MSKLSKYLQLSCNDNKVNEFRQLSIGLVDKDTKNKKIIKDIEKKFKVKSDILEVIESINKELKKEKIKYRFDFITESQIKVDKIKSKRKKIEKIKINNIKLNDRFNDLKEEIEMMLKRRIK